MEWYSICACGDEQSKGAYEGNGEYACDPCPKDLTLKDCKDIGKYGRCSKCAEPFANEKACATKQCCLKHCKRKEGELHRQTYGQCEDKKPGQNTKCETSCRVQELRNRKGGGNIVNADNKRKYTYECTGLGYTRKLQDLKDDYNRKCDTETHGIDQYVLKERGWCECMEKHYGVKNCGAK